PPPGRAERVGQLLGRGRRGPVGPGRRDRGRARPGRGPGCRFRAGRVSVITGAGLRARLASGAFAVTAEISPPRRADPGALLRKADPLRGWADAVTATENAGAHVRMASWAGSLLAAQAGIEPVMQLTCRDRNRLALQSDLLAAWAVGIPNVLLMTGDHPKFGDDPGAAAGFRLGSAALGQAPPATPAEGRPVSR